MDDEKVQRHNATKLKWMRGGAASNWALKSPRPNRYGQETRSFHTRRGGLGHFFSVVL